MTAIDGRSPVDHSHGDAAPPASAAVILRALQAARPAVPGLGFNVASRWDPEGVRHNPTEYRVASRLPDIRRNDFLLGRRAMRSALAQIGIAAAAIPRVGDRPQLPAGSVGSISHSKGIAVALAGAARRFRAIGVDLELLSLPLTAAHLFLDDSELTWLHRPDAAWQDAERRLLAAFSAKESALKALGPMLGRAPRLRDIRLEPVGDGFAARIDGWPGPVLRVSVRAIQSGVFSWTALAHGRPRAA